MDLEIDERWMRRAVEMARRGWGTTHPNPAVGAVLATADELISEGYHEVAGGPHAEVDALRKVGDRRIPPSATLYVTLEPCSTVGRTPACTQAILDAGIKRVVVGALDDDSRHQGKGLEILRSAGVTVSSGVLAAECHDLNLIFHFWHRKKRPLIAAKVATTIDGRTATETGASKWITGEKSRENVHIWRRYFPAIAVGARTAVADDPSLTARLGSKVYCPIRIVFDRSGRLANFPDRRLFTDRFRDRTVIMVSEESMERVRAAVPDEVRVVPCPSEGGIRSFLLDWLAGEDLRGLYVEGGSVLHSLLFAEKAVDYLFAYRAPKLFLDERSRPIAGGQAIRDPAEAIYLEECRHEIFGSDQLIRGRVCYPDTERSKNEG